MNEDLDILKCGRCGTDLKTINTVCNYLGYKFPVELEGCPNCGFIYVPEKLVNTRVLEIEALLEEK